MRSIANAFFCLLMLQSLNTFGQVSHQFSTEQKLDTLFKGYNNSTPGIAVTILKDGKPIFKKAYGMANLEFRVPFSHNTLVRIPYSEGREFISIAAVLMENEKLLSLDDKVRKYFPNLPLWSENVTIQDLLNHSSGFADEWNMLMLMHNSMANRFESSQFLRLLYNQPSPEVDPGKGYMYSNSDFGLLRLIMEKAAGEGLSVYMERRIFAPLKMANTRLNDDKEEVITNRAFSYLSLGNGKYSLWLRDKTSPGGNYFVLTSADDLENWAAALTDLNSFVSRAVMRLKQNARPIPVMAGVNYVFGHKLKQVGEFAVRMHMGVTGAPYLSYVPAQKLSIICVTNKKGSYLEEVMQVLQHVLGMNEKKAPTTRKKLPEQFRKTNEDLKKYTGVYKWRESLTFQSSVERKRFSEFVLKGDSLLWIYSSDDTVYMMPVGEGIFKDEGFPLWLSFKQQHPDSLVKAEFYSGHSNETIHLLKITTPKVVHTSEQLQKMVGRYYSEHLNYYLTITLSDKNKLVVKRPTLPDKILQPIYDGDFMLETEFHKDDISPAWIKFFFDNAGNVTHFTVSSPRMMGHRLDKVQ